MASSTPPSPSAPESRSNGQFRKCAVCSKPDSIPCRICQIVAYCSPECKTRDRANHRSACAVANQEYTEELGNHMVANRDLAAGTFIMEDKLAICGPSHNYRPPYPRCLGCFVLTGRKCSTCAWPVCSKICEEVVHHKYAECEHFAKEKVIYTTEHDYGSILALRACIMKEKNPELWNRISELQCEFGIRELRTESVATRAAWESMKAREDFKMVDKVTNDEWEQTYMRTRINALSFYTITGPEETERSGEYLYLRASMLSHSCVPNCYYMISPVDNQLYLIAAIDIQKGKPLTISYINHNRLHGTRKRQKDLLQLYGFLCKCIRCKDKTELGTYMSAWICPLCKSNVLPKNAMDRSSYAVWECASPGCKFVFLLETVDQMTEEIKEQVYAGWKNNDRALLSQVISRNSGEVVHPNHWTMVEARRGILRSLAIMMLIGRESEAQRVAYAEHAEILLHIVEKVNPGISLISAGLKLSLCAVYLPQLQTDLKEGRITMTMAQFNDRLSNIEQRQEEAYKYFRSDVTDLMIPGAAEYSNASALLQMSRCTDAMKRQSGVGKSLPDLNGLNRIIFSGANISKFL